ncbi:MAG: hypothetical protein L3J54_11560 [Draconibacterium sp.]|nr:hypothetical protein [Draconibacterium sp.]
MKNLKKLSILILVVTGLSLLNSCNKDEIVADNVIVKTTVTDYITMINSFSLTTVEELSTGDEDGLKSATISDCLTVTVHENEDGEFWPRNWTFDYGTENCESVFGNEKRGMIHVSLSDWWKNEGSFREITFEDFYINDNKMEGVKTILNTGLNENGNLSFTKKVTDAKLTYADGTSMTWACEKLSEQVEGAETILFADNVWSVTGTGSGVDLDGNNYTMQITSALIYKNGCFYPVSGIVEISTEGQELKVINYGDGECDNIITVTVGDVTETVEL